MRYRNLIVVIFATGFFNFAEADIYQDPQNLKVLPKDISPKELRATMRSFALDVGLRCSSCHVGEEGQRLEEYDFASDDETLKDKARKMLKMVTTINQDHLSQFGDDAITVNCLTCHRGVSQPLSLGQVLANTAATDGAEAIKSKYTSLKDEYYGSGSYDFSEFNLSQIARERGMSGHPHQAKAILNIILDENPESFEGHFLYGELMARVGDAEQAKQHYKKALEINPEAEPWVGPRLEKLNQE